jgi:dsRNA-specific ribonuclease
MLFGGELLMTLGRVRKLDSDGLLGHSGDLYSQIPLGEHDPPALPTMAPKVWQSAFVHNSKYPSQHRRRLNYDNPTNEGLEFLGDALLYVRWSDLLGRTKTSS